jgi:hypothetical protein
MNGDWKTFLSAVWDEKGKRMDVIDRHISEGAGLGPIVLLVPPPEHILC